MQMSYKNSIDIAREREGKCGSVKFVNRKLKIEKSKWERGLRLRGKPQLVPGSLAFDNVLAPPTQKAKIHLHM